MGYESFNEAPKCKHKDTSPCWRYPKCTLSCSSSLPIANCCAKYYKLDYWKCLVCGEWLKGSRSDGPKGQGGK